MRKCLLLLLSLILFSGGSAYAQNKEHLHDQSTHLMELQNKRFQLEQGEAFPSFHGSPLIQRFRNGIQVRDLEGLTSIKLLEPICELKASDEVANTNVRPPSNLQDRNGINTRENTDCADIQVEYIFPESFTQTQKDDYVFAFEYAVAIWVSSISSPVTIKVEANLQPLSPGVLGSARANRIWTPGDGVIYPDALIDQLFGTDVTSLVLGLDEPDIICNFSTTFGWYLGVDGQAPPGTYDFATVVLHELGHGLGFFGSGLAIDDPVLGTYGFGFSSPLPAIYDLFVEDGSGTPITSIGPPGSVSPALGAYLQSDDLFINAPSVNVEIGGPGKIYAPPSFRQGSSYSHWDEATFLAGDPNSLMTPFLGFQEANHDPGAITLGMFFDHGWILSQDCDGPIPVDLSENCDITGISFDPNFAGGNVVCDNPGVFSAEGGAFGPVGSHVACFRIEGIDPFSQPLDETDYYVKIKGKEYPIFARGYDYFEDELYFYICVGGIPSDGKKNLQVKIKLAPGCTYTQPKLYDAPDCGIESSLRAGSSIAVRNSPKEFSAFPNPTNGFLNIELPAYSDVRLQIFNSVGKVIEDRNIHDTQFLQLDLSNQTPGVYFVKMLSESESITKKILLTK
jgi:hypothetical protein